MLMFTLAIFCLTTSNLPWFMDLTFQIPMQYCSLQHQTWLTSPVTSTTGHYFCFGSASSFFLELFLHSSPVAYCVPTDLGSSSFSVISYCLFILLMGFSRQEYWSFSSSHVCMWQLDYKGSWAWKNWCFWTVGLEKTLKSPFDWKEIKPVNPKGNQSWIFIGRTDAEAKSPVLWPPDVKSLLIRKDPDAGKDWRREEKGTTEDEMVGWHHQLTGHESEQTWEIVNREAYSAAVHGITESDTTEQLNNDNIVALPKREGICVFVWVIHFAVQ